MSEPVVFVTYTKQIIDSRMRIEFVVDFVRKQQIRHFWLPLNPVGYNRKDTLEVIIKRMIARILKEEYDEIHLMYFTGELSTKY